MSILKSIRDALAAVFGGAAPAEDTSADDEPAATHTDDPSARGDSTHLDPDAVTEARAGATDDAVDALRSLRQPPADASDDGAKAHTDESGQVPDEADASDGQTTTRQDEARRDPTDPGGNDRDANQ